MLENNAVIKMDLRIAEQQFHMMIQKHFLEMQSEIEEAITQACQDFNFKSVIKEEIDRQIRDVIRKHVQNGLANLRGDAIKDMLTEMFDHIR